jgi:uncharacterized protein YjbI with pentapeptide repeats
VAVAVGWDVCSADDCIGESVESGCCIAHLEDETLERVLLRMKADGALVARGVVVSEGLLTRLLERFRREGGERRWVVGDVEFAGARFESRAAFTGIVFEGRARFEHAVFKGGVSFSGAVFKHSPLFEGATFEGDALFGPNRWAPWSAVKRGPGEPPPEHTVFERRGQFGEAVFHNRAGFTGVSFGHEALFDRVVFEGESDFEAARFESRLSLEGAEFRAQTSFARAEFRGDVRLDAELARASFDGAVFATVVSPTWRVRADISFRDVVFESAARFFEMELPAGADFTGAEFRDVADFSTIVFRGEASFANATFEAVANFYGASVQADASAISFAGVSFNAPARFTAVEFASGASFAKAKFVQDVDFSGARIGQKSSRLGGMVLRGATFERARTIGSLAATSLDLDETVFRQRMRLDVVAREISCQATHFLGGADLRIRWAEIAMEETEFGRPTTVVPGRRAVSGLDEPFVDVLASDLVRTESPRIVSVRRTDVANLTLSRVDLRPCRLATAVNLDGLHLEEARFASTPPGWRWTKRQSIAEEHEWRASRGGRRSRGWYPRECWWHAREQVSAPQIAAIYRALRKGHEDAKDEPGAADFYYGEMEMRRHGSVSRVERGILFLYWLVSGYGLRASRALASLAVTVLMFAVLFDAWGLRHDESFGTAVLFSVESTTSLLRGPERELTAFGETLWIALRLLGPLFFGLAILSLRGRVKR